MTEASSANSLPRNYYDFFELPHHLILDLKELEKRFYALSRRFHPDVYARRSAAEQDYALEATAILNDGYRTLRDPITRAEYLLKENNLDLTEQKSNDVLPELLEEVFEMNMALEELKAGDEEARGPLQQARSKFLQLREDLHVELDRLGERYDESLDRNLLPEVRALLNRRRYIRNLIRGVEAALDGNAIRENAQEVEARL